MMWKYKYINYNLSSPPGIRTPTRWTKTICTDRYTRGLNWAEDRARTGHPRLGRTVLYQMSYFRKFTRLRFHQIRYSRFFSSKPCGSYTLKKSNTLERLLFLFIPRRLSLRMSNQVPHSLFKCWTKHSRYLLPFEPPVGIEPTTYWLQISCSTSWAKEAIVWVGVSSHTRLKVSSFFYN